MPMCLFISDCFYDTGDAAIDDEDPWSVFTCPTQPLLTFSVVSPGSLVPPVQVCLIVIDAQILSLGSQCFNPLQTIVIGTLAVDGWAIMFGTTWAGFSPAQSPPHCTKCNSPPSGTKWQRLPTGDTLRIWQQFPYYECYVTYYWPTKIYLYRSEPSTTHYKYLSIHK